MLTLNDGRSELWQWDTGRKLTVGAECSQVHFSNKVFGRSIDMPVIDGVVEIPDFLLQTDKDLTAWAFVGTAENGYTKISKVFKVNKRNKPADYVFSPTEQTTLSEIKERLDDLEAMQDPDAIKNAVDDYLANNPIKVEETDPTVPDWAKKPTKPTYTAEEVGALPSDTVIPVIPEALPNPHALTFTGAVDVIYDGSKPVEVAIPKGGGGVTPTAAEKIVHYTVDADGASALKFAFTVAEYPALAKYNRLRGIIRRAANAGMEWVQVCVNNAVIGQTPKGSHGMLGFEVLKHGDYYRGSTGGTQNISMYGSWTNSSQFSYSGYNRLLPAKIDSLTSITVQSWVEFLDEGARIEIWGWNE